ncbi:MAG: bifunctional diaminohydroxyphosphoribosylaminopyrimidine deaminase/5-amino-6-(5-phosphoribosylamino)uracil reductase RibD [bacterium]
MRVFDSQDKDFMQLALSLAQKGRGCVLPNPLVGAVVVKDGKIISQGYHAKFGSDHAEVNALREAEELAIGATLYVTLEPCSHFGKTPPCVDRILQANIQRVVVAMQDPNPTVSGNGIAKLRANGVQVDAGLLEKEALALNRPFVKFITRQLPFVTLKIAQTLDGRIADCNGRSKWITGAEALALVHQWRFEAGAVLVGIGTVLADNPRLTVRHIEGKQPIRIVLDAELRIPLNCHLLTDDFVEKTLIFTKDSGLQSKKVKAITARGAQVLKVPVTNQFLPIQEVLAALAKLDIAHVLVEGGAEIFSSFLKEKCADRLSLVIAEKIFGDGKMTMNFAGFSAENPLVFENSTWEKIGRDRLFLADFRW